MSLSLWRNVDPFFDTDTFLRDFDRMSKQLDRLMPTTGMETTTQQEIFRPNMDIKETDNNLVISAELPGVRKEDFNIELDNGILKISGEKKHEKKEEKENFRRVERM